MHFSTTNNLITWKRKNDRAAQTARVLVQLCVVLSAKQRREIPRFGAPTTTRSKIFIRYNYFRLVRINFRNIRRILSPLGNVVAKILIVAQRCMKNEVSLPLELCFRKCPNIKRKTKALQTSLTLLICSWMIFASRPNIVSGIICKTYQIITTPVVIFHSFFFFFF